MTIPLIFWILMLFALVFGLGWGWDRTNRLGMGNNLLLWLLLLLLGWGVFGAPIK